MTWVCRSSTRYDATLIFGLGRRRSRSGPLAESCYGDPVTLISSRLCLAGDGGAHRHERTADCRRATPGSIPVTPNRHARQTLLDLLGSGFLAGLARPQGRHLDFTSPRTWLVISVLAVLGVELRQHDYASQTWRGPQNPRSDVVTTFLMCAREIGRRAAGHVPPGVLRDNIRSSLVTDSFIHQTRLDSLRVMESAQAALAKWNGHGGLTAARDMGPPCVRLSGWAIDPESKEPAPEVALFVQETRS
jgi:hypothetical protein